MSRLTENLFHAWASRGRRIRVQAEAIVAAPLLFKPSEADRLEAELNRVQTETERWAAQS